MYLFDEILQVVAEPAPHSGHHNGMTELKKETFCSDNTELLIQCCGSGSESGSVGSICYEKAQAYIKFNFLGLPDRDSLIRDSDPDPSIIKQK